MPQYTMTIGGASVSGDASFGVVDPALGTVHAEAPDCGPGQLDAAFEAAALAYRSWRKNENARRKALHAMRRSADEQGQRAGPRTHP